jgi:hypothetical protein
MRQQLRKPRKLKNRILPQKSKTKFECRVISNPVELSKMGYTTSKQVESVNNNEVVKKVVNTRSQKIVSVNNNETLKKVGNTHSKKVSPVNDYEFLMVS